MFWNETTNLYILASYLDGERFNILAFLISHTVQNGLYNTQGSTWVKNEVRHGHFKSCRNPTWLL